MLVYLCYPAISNC